MGQFEWSPRYRTYSTRWWSKCKRSEYCKESNDDDDDDDDDDDTINYPDYDDDDDDDCCYQ